MLSKSIRTLVLGSALAAIACSPAAASTTVHPSNGKYMGRDISERSIKFEVNHHKIENFRIDGDKIFDSEHFSGSKFDIKVPHSPYRVKGEFVSEHYIEGFIAHHDALSLFDAHEFAF